MTDCTVPAHVVVYAIRYGLNRATGAHDDALALIRQHWPALRPYRASLAVALAASGATQPAPVSGVHDIADAVADITTQGDPEDGGQ